MRKPTHPSIIDNIIFDHWGGVLQKQIAYSNGISEMTVRKVLREAGLCGQGRRRRLNRFKRWNTQLKFPGF